MTKKNILIVVIIIAILAIVAIGVYSITSNNSSETNYVTYEGNGGITSDGDISVTSTNEVVQESMFTYDGNIFNSWNTKADGSGITYESGDSIEFGTILYAIWTETYSVTNYSIDIGPLTMIFNGDTVDTSSLVIIFPAVLSTNVITLTGITNWEYSGAIFSCTYDNKTWYLDITVIDSDSTTCDLVDGVPTITIDASKDIEITILFTTSG